MGSSDADVVQTAVVAQGDGAGFVDDVVADPVVGEGVGDHAWNGFGCSCAARIGFTGAGSRRGSESCQPRYECFSGVLSATMVTISRT